jgi:hypothetical protein
MPGRKCLPSPWCLFPGASLNFEAPSPLLSTIVDDSGPWGLGRGSGVEGERENGGCQGLKVSAWTLGINLVYLSIPPPCQLSRPYWSVWLLLFCRTTEHPHLPCKDERMDASVSKLVDVYADNVIAAHNADKAGADQPEELDVDAMFDQLENEDDGILRERRLAQLHRE